MTMLVPLVCRFQKYHYCLMAKLLLSKKKYNQLKMGYLYILLSYLGTS